MTQIIEATFDGQVFHLLEATELEPNTTVQLVITVKEQTTSPVSFLDVVSSLNLEGPTDWSVRIDDDLYGGASLDFSHE